MEPNNQSPRIDAHHHFWKYTPEEYDWIDDAMRLIRRDYLPEDLEQAIRSCGIDSVVSVQARQTLEETRWLLELTSRHSFIGGVVGWVPLVARDVVDTLASLMEPGRLKAVRHVLQGADAYMLRADFNGLGLRGLGPETKLGGSLLVIAIIGGAVFTPLMGLVAEATRSMAEAMVVPLICYIVVMAFAFLGPRMHAPERQHGYR